MGYLHNCYSSMFRVGDDLVRGSFYGVPDDTPYFPGVIIWQPYPWLPRDAWYVGQGDTPLGKEWRLCSVS